MTEQSNTHYFTQVTKLSERTNISIEALKQLPEESLSGYYNRTGAQGSDLAILAGGLSIGILSIAMGFTIDQHPPAAIILAGLASGIFMLTITGISVRSQNAQVANEIADELAGIKKEPTETAPKPS